VVLPETSVANAARMAERLRKHISKLVVEWEGEKISITASFGVTGFSASKPFETVLAEDLVNMADRYLYQAKNEGRNKVVSGAFEKSD
jgi:diguanylate cyclase (GGDEF)-like protein